MAKQPEEQNIKSRARRRLIGAIALALSVVVILPMVLDSEPRSTGQDIDLRIPASDKASEFVPGMALSEVAEAASLAESSAVASSPAASEVQAGPNAVPMATASGKITVADVRSVVQASADKQPENKQAETKIVKKSEVRPAEPKKSEAKPAEVKKTEVKPVEVKKPEVRKAETKPDEKPAISYIVQTGAFSNAGTAMQEADKLKAWGFKAYTEQVSGTTRVRVGPYVDRNKADEVRLLLEKHGQHPVVTVVK